MVTKSPPLCVDRDERVGCQEEKPLSPPGKHSVSEMICMFYSLPTDNQYVQVEEQIPRWKAKSIKCDSKLGLMFCSKVGKGFEM